MKKSWRRFAPLCLALAFAFVFSACTTGGTNQTNGGSAGAGETVDHKTESGGKDSKKIKIGFSMDTLQEERWQRDRDYLVAKGEALGAEVLVQSANSDDAKQIAQAENLISQGVDILIVVPHNADAAAAIVEKAHAAGIKVIAYDRLITNSDVDLYVSFDSVLIGELQAKTVVEKAPKGKYVLIGGADTDYAAHLYKKGQMNILQPLVDKGDIQIVYDQWTKDWNPAVALANMENALTANNNQIDAVIATNDGTAGAVIQALAAQNLAGKIPVSGLDAELAACQRVVEGTQLMTVYTSIKDMAETAAEVAVKMARGEQVETNATENNGKIDVPTILLEPVAATKETMDATVIAEGFHKREDVYKNVK
ncbi:D-xylose-binding periplasmic protein [Paenibacillus sp. CECT 9249]|uniref:D-xylose ABC transporter substrate-binding protein n=1 Tax=Paenibacillus sp. CECT 9249 TaxID=2845385 RepID=UPI001E30FBC7|nr:D-xylose ABC transporter substrate-binding protein [Paenibacillus sp. CECT 9249]CAH0119295.1 D-xylose-binding periplasmic protein [Paenibacillus sp. CECT 9249]